METTCVYNSAMQRGFRKDLLFCKLVQDDSFNRTMPEYTSQNGPRLSCWSRYDVGQHRPSSTDHWAKRRSQIIDSSAQGANIFSSLRSSQSTTFEHMIANDLRMPENSSQPIRRLNREATKTSFNEKARAGFQYWLIERPKPTSFGKYGMGSYKTVLGIGNAPRT